MSIYAASRGSISAWAEEPVDGVSTVGMSGVDLRVGGGAIGL